MITAEEILKIIHSGESSRVELKKCKNAVPDSVWGTYSAFANTRGGTIILGVSEDKTKPVEKRFTITGVEDSYKVVTDFFNTLNNTQKVSQSVLVDSDVRIVSIDEKEVIYIRCPKPTIAASPSISTIISKTAPTNECTKEIGTPRKRNLA